MKLQNYMQIKAAATLLGVSVKTLCSWERQGKLATYRHPINWYRLYRTTDLAALLAAVQRSDQPIAEH